MAFLTFVACDTPEGPDRPTIEIQGSVTDSVEKNLNCAEGVHTHDFQLVPWR
jgi:hypothetical protein